VRSLSTTPRLSPAFCAPMRVSPSGFVSAHEEPPGAVPSASVTSGSWAIVSKLAVDAFRWASGSVWS
jgi:hypothetical protein